MERQSMQPTKSMEFLVGRSCVCSPRTVDGFEYVPWIGRLFGDCVYTPTDQTSFVLGLISLGAYILCLLPQLWHNFKRKSVEGLSFTLVLVWAVADMLNFMGTLLTHQLPIQRAVSLYFVLTDIASVGQYLWYEKTTRGRGQRRRVQFAKGSGLRSGGSTTDTLSEDEDLVAGEETPLFASSSGSQQQQRRRSPGFIKWILTKTLLLGCGVTLVSAGFENALNDLPLCDAKTDAGRVAFIFGSIMAWVSGLLYFYSRIPQILENARKKSVEGLSIALFFCTILGNLTYGASILMRHPPLDTHFYASTLPYIVGSLGVLMFDLMILGQFVLFSPSPEVASRLGEEEIEP